MGFLAGSDALIFDLRDNGGGSPSMIQLLTAPGFWTMKIKALVAVLSQRFRVLTYDRRGHSRTERPAAPETGTRAAGLQR